MYLQYIHYTALLTCIMYTVYVLGPAAQYDTWLGSQSTASIGLTTWDMEKIAEKENKRICRR